METKCKFHNLQFDMNGQQFLTLAIQGDFRPYIEEFDGKELKAEIKPFIEKNVGKRNGNFIKKTKGRAKEKQEYK